MANEETPLLPEAPIPQPDAIPDQIENGGPGKPKEELSNSRLALVMGSIWVGVFLGALDGTIIATLSAPISTEFNSLSLLSWLASAYLM